MALQGWKEGKKGQGGEIDITTYDFKEHMALDELNEKYGFYNQHQVVGDLQWHFYPKNSVFFIFFETEKLGEIVFVTMMMKNNLLKMGDKSDLVTLPIGCFQFFTPENLKACL